MSIILPDLPYDKNALTPYISEKTLQFHYDKHHASYVNKLNPLLENSPFSKATLEEIILESTGAIFNNAAQVWNHTFYWNSLSPQSQKQNLTEIKNILEKSFGSFSSFKEQFTIAALKHFGSGWTWLVKDSEGKLKITSTKNAHNPLQDKQTPLLTCDVWEHAYYIDYKNKRPDYLEAFWNIVNWNFIIQNLEK